MGTKLFCREKEELKATYSDYTLPGFEKSILAEYDFGAKYRIYISHLHLSTTEMQRRATSNIFAMCYSLHDGVKIYNAFLYHFLYHYPEYLNDYKDGFQKGYASFTEKYSVRLPTLNQIALLSNIYNTRFKNCTEVIQSIYNADNVRKAGIENGLLAAYAEYEHDYKHLFLSVNDKRDKTAVPSVTKDDTFKIIDNEFKTLKGGWEYTFRSEQDYLQFVDLLAKYYRHEKYELPREVIKTKKNTKTETAKTLNRIDNDLGNAPKRGNTKLFNIMRTLQIFENLNDQQLENTLGK